MKTGIPKLDDLLGDVEPGSVVLIETVGELGIEIIINTLIENKGKSAAFVTPRLKRRMEKTPALNGLIYLTLGEDFAPQELFKITHSVRQLPNDRFLGVFFLQPLLVFHPPQTVYRFFSELSDIARERGLVLMTLVDKRLVSDKTLATFEDASTHVIDIVEVVEGFKITRGIRIKKSPKEISGYYHLELKEGKVIIGESLG
ncbi:hypothetical protein PAP_03400 [Palaeococcus pacificus DY20341]|uniref:KaiC-like domain-containing protein n=1 Tax=Palaeococcus pacificus DY20341 TaxID=1343739 RepID=A0A075LQW7_9EURY|nr:hypothetical protein [Palaeococcus pacificus]AIF69100.1 hypothetical protein PAP_03400 [Palaeococcus pacificus DY20341]